MNQIENTKECHSKAAVTGFTLIELMIAVAIVGILAALALPAFGNYMARARVSEAIGVAQGCKTSIAEFHATNGTFPANPDEASCEDLVTENIKSMGWNADNRAIEIVFSDGEESPLPEVVRGKTLSIQPVNSSNALAAPSERIVAWQCGIEDTSGKDGSVWDYMPSSCRNMLLDDGAAAVGG